MSIRFLRFVWIVSVAFTSVAVRAQGSSSFSVNSRVRILLVDSLRQAPLSPRRQQIIGLLVRATADSLFVQMPGATTAGVGRAAVKGVWESRGASRAQSAGSSGLGLGVLGAAVAYEVRGRGSYHRGQDVLVAGALAFAGGALIGALSPFEHWHRVRW